MKVFEKNTLNFFRFYKFRNYRMRNLKKIYFRIHTYIKNSRKVVDFSVLLKKIRIKKEM